MFPLQTTVFSKNVPIVTWLLIGLNVMVFMLEAGLPKESLEQFSYMFGVVPARFTHPEWAARVGFPIGNYWPFVTSMFLHGGLLHIVGNMWTLAIFGRNVEDRMGPLRFLVFYLFCGIASGIVHAFVNADSTLPAIGASGAIAGVMGAYLVMYPTSRVVVMVPIFIFPFFFDFLAVFYLGYWFLLNFVSGMASLTQTADTGGVAFWAHIGGFIVGAGILPLFLVRKPSESCHGDEGCLEQAWHRLS